MRPAASHARVPAANPTPAGRAASRATCAAAGQESADAAAVKTTAASSDSHAASSRLGCVTASSLSPNIREDTAKNPAADYQVLNVGTGRPVSIVQVAECLAAELGWGGGFEIVHKFRAGDIRHCYADISRISTLLGFSPRVRFEDGARELAGWVREQQAQASRVGEANQQLAAHGLIR